MAESSNSVILEKEKNLPNQYKQGYKKTKLGWIPEDWKILKVSDIFEFVPSNSYSRNQLHYSGSENSIYNIHYGDIHATYKNPILDFDVESFIPTIIDTVNIYKTAKYLKEGDVIVADASEDYEGVGKAVELKNINNKKVLAGLHTFALRDKFLLTSNGYRAYIFKNRHISKALKVIATGSKVYGISKANLAKFELVLPTIGEQKKIAQILSTWDKAITKTEQLITKKQERKKGLMQQLLTGKRRFKEFVDEKVLPVEFGKLVQRSKSKYNPKKMNENFPCIELEHIDQGTGILLGHTESKNQSSTKNHFQKGEVLFGKLRPYLRKYLHPEFEGVCSSEIWVLKANDNLELDHGYLFYLVQSHNFIEACKATTGSKMPRADWDHVTEFPFHFPLLIEQKKITAVLSSADQEISSLEKQLTKLKEQKKGLMQKLLTGEVRVKI